MEQEKQETGQAKFPTESFQKGRISPPQSGEKTVQNGVRPEKTGTGRRRKMQQKYRRRSAYGDHSVLNASPEERSRLKRDLNQIFDLYQGK